MSIRQISRRLFMIPVVALALTACTETVSMRKLAREMADRTHLTYLPGEDYSLKQFSSYNPASVEPGKPGWFENNDLSHFIRIENNGGRREFVLFDAAGPGAIVRWWMTFYKAQNGILRVYIDNDTIPSIKGAPVEVLSGTLLTAPPFAKSVQDGAPLGEEGRDYDHNLYLPVPFSLHCKITYECDSLRLLYEYEGTLVPQGYYWPDVFYNIGYRDYNGKVKVESFSEKALKRASSVLNEAGQQLLNDQVSSDYEEPFDEILRPGDSAVIEFTGKRQAINHIVTELEAENKNQALRSTVIKASFDGNKTIWTPVGEFFGSGYTTNPHKTWMNKADMKGILESYWIMPFRDSCSIVFINYGNENIRIRGVCGVIPYQWKKSSMYFHASWHEYNKVKTRDIAGAPFDLNFIDIRGRGLYVGDQVTLFNNSYKWWGEGDEKIFVDGEAFPSSFGTGSEDYYGYSFARQEPFSHPFISQPEGTGNMNWGISVNMRHRSLDAIPFHTSISSNIELWHWDAICMNYALTTYFYALPSCTTNISPDIEGTKRAVARSKGDLDCDPAKEQQSDYYTAADFLHVPKIDAHFHYLTHDDRYMKFAASQNFQLLTPIWDGEEVSVADQQRVSNALRLKYPESYAYFITFPANRFADPDFADKTIALIKEAIRSGATGVKIWKNIGMVIKGHEGNYLMVDDPVFDPVFNYLEAADIPVIAHLGEPKDCWLPEDQMTDPSDVVYYKNNPQYYMFLHPGVPSYEAQIEARDNLLESHPRLEFVGAHLGSLEWNLDELAKRLDRFPNMKADLAARLFHVQYQSERDYEGVRNFMIRYQDRIIYGTDTEVHDFPGMNPDKTMENLRRGWLSQWIYLATDSILTVRGLKLPKEVIDKIYFKNAESYFHPLIIK